MDMMVPFRFVDFHDVPRTIAVRHRGKLFLLQSAFDEKLDDYPDIYSVYILPESVEESLARSSWEFLETTALNCIGKVRVQSVTFDVSKSRALDPSFLDGLTGSPSPDRLNPSLSL